MDVELLVIPGCPNEASAAALLRGVLDDVGLRSTGVRRTVVASQDEAERRGFAGSPTILLDGTDPFAGPQTQPALACRVYVTAAGPAGIPSLRDLRQALKHAAAIGR